MKPLPFAIRRATPSDAADIAAAHGDSIRSLGPLFYPAETVKAWGSGLTSALYVKAMERGEAFWIAVAGPDERREVLGFSSHRIDGNEHGTAVYVRGDAARRGVGSALLRVAEDSARRAGAISIDIDASLAAVAFYERHGFREIGRGEHRLASGCLMPCVFMRKTLRPDPEGRAL